jgi:hypothetical protein
MNGNWYSCLLENEYCAITSDYATLTVDSLNAAGEVIEAAIDLAVWPNPFADNLNLYNYKDCSDLQISIFNANGVLVYSEMYQDQSPDKLKIDLMHLSNGFYLMKVTGINREKYFNETMKIIKTN